MTLLGGMPFEAAEFTGGRGDDLVLLHGLGSRWQVFVPVLTRLTRTHRVTALDFPGFGARPLDPAVRLDVDGLADWVSRQLAARGLHRPHIVGSSMGGAVALELARRGDAGAVTAFAPIGFGNRIERTGTRALLAALRAAAKRMPDALARAVRTSAGRAVLLWPTFGHPVRIDPAVAVADLRALGTCAGFDEALASVAAQGPSAAAPGVPTTIVWGSRDAVLPCAPQSRRARRLLPEARHVVLRGAGHLPFADDPARCAALILGARPAGSRRPSLSGAAAMTAPQEAA